MTITYLTHSETLNPVVESQGLMPARNAFPSDRLKWLALTPCGQLMRRAIRIQVRSAARRAKTSFGIETRVALIGPSRWQHSPMAKQWVVHQIARRLSVDAPDVLWARSGVATVAAIAARRRLKASFHVVFDCRGDEVSEGLSKLGADVGRPDGWSASARSTYEKLLACEKAAAEADSIVVVSTAMSQLLQTRHGVSPSAIRLQPCCVDLEQFPNPDKGAARRRLGLTDELVVGYMGSLEWYQRVDESLRLFRLIRASYPKAIFLGITSHPSRMREAIARASIPEHACRVLSVSRDQVPHLLSAADLGLLLRSSDAVNAVASPVKFAEYLACGVPVVITPGVGDYSGMVDANELGVCIRLDTPDDDSINALRPVIQLIRGGDGRLERHCRQFAAERLSWQAYRRNSGTLSRFAPASETFCTEGSLGEIGRTYRYSSIADRAADTARQQEI